MLTILMAASAYVVGRQSTTPAAPVETGAGPASPKTSAAPIRASSHRLAPPPPVTQPERLTLAAVQEADWKKIGVGCSCTFTQGIPRRELRVAGGDGVAVLRPGGRLRVCALREEQTQEMFDGETVVKCGATRVQLKAFGKRTPGYDGHASDARMTIIDEGREANFTGTLGCGC